MSAQRVSVVIPTLDPGADLAPLLDALLAQEVPGGVEILILDSGTRSGGLAALGRAPVRRLDIPPGAFDHGLTRQRGAEAARGDLVAFLVQDALPLPGCLHALVDALDRIPDADGAYARQLPRPDADPAVAERLARAFPPGDAPVVKRLPPGGWDALPQPARLALARYDHVCAMARRGALMARPLPRTAFGEDLLWAMETLQAGRALAYVPAAAVVHSHRRPPAEVLARTRREHALLAARLGVRTVPDLAHLARGAASIASRAARGLGGDALGALGEAGRLGAELLGQYLGARDVD